MTEFESALREKTPDKVNIKCQILEMTIDFEMLLMDLSLSFNLGGPLICNNVKL